MVGPPSSPGQPVIALQMTDEDVVAAAAKLLGNKCLDVSRDSQLAKGYKRVYMTVLRGLPAVNMMRLLRPLMGLRRKALIDRALKSYFVRPRPCPKIPREDRPAIRERIKSGEKAAAIAREYGVDRSTISLIKRGLLK